jgi:hypothetical protein
VVARLAGISQRGVSQATNGVRPVRHHGVREEPVSNVVFMAVVLQPAVSSENFERIDVTWTGVYPMWLSTLVLL